MRLRSTATWLWLLAAACGRIGEGAAAKTEAAGEIAGTARPVVDTNPPGPGARRISRVVAELRDSSKTPVIRALYVNRFAAQSAKRLRWFMHVADSTEINGLVIDMKDEFGLNYRSSNPQFRRNEGSEHGVVRDVPGLIDTLHAHDVLAIARIVVFKDPVTAARNPAWTIRGPDSSLWHDKKGIAWVDPYNHALWDYNLGVAEELVKLGFDEIQFDYIRFPEPYKSLPVQIFPAAKGQTKVAVLAEFLRTARQRLNALGVRATADIFGLVTTVHGPLEVGQEWEKISPNVDVVLPMVYPSHYPRGSFGIPSPNADPYRVIKISLDTARIRDKKLGIAAPEHVRPWLQAFHLGAPDYGPEQLRAEKKATYDAGYDGWTLWNPGSKYDVFVPAFDRKAPTAAFQSQHPN